MIRLTTEQAQQIEQALVATTLNKDYWLEKCMDSLDTIRAARAQEQAEQEPVAVISESAIGLVKLHSNGACLPFGTPLYAAPVSAEAIRAEALEEVVKFLSESGLITPTGRFAAAIRGLK